MSKISFIFDEDKFSKISPFYILLDKSLTITSLGKSIAKVFPAVTTGIKFERFFKVKRPHISSITIQALTENIDQLIILELKDGDGLFIRGQFESINGGFLFIGSPWFTSMEEVKKKNLSITDFAIHDPLLDLLQILRTQELTTLQLKDLLKINNEQKDQLAKDKEELNKLSLVASTNENAIVFTHPTAEIFWCNDAYITLTGFSREEIMGKTPIEIGRTETTDKDTLKVLMERFYNGDSFDLEIVHRRKNKSDFWTRIKGQPIFNDEGKVVQYFAMIEDKTTEKEQEEQLVLLSLITQKNINAVMICDKDGYIEWVNPSFTEISGYQFHELIGKKPGPLLQGEESDPVTVQYLHDQIEKGLPFNCEIINYNKQGKKYWIKIQGQALYNKQGDVTRFFALQEDITDKKTLESQKEELLNSLEKSNKELEDYAQIVSHDLKAPLRNINTLITWIIEDYKNKLDDEAQKSFTLIQFNLEKMDLLINGILDYSSIDKLDSENRTVDFNLVLEEISRTIMVPANIEFKIATAMPCLQGNFYRFRQLLQNLIENAIKYNDKEKGYIEVGCHEKGDFVEFYIKDNGKGIPEAYFDKIFKVFTKLESNTHSSGIGLSTVKKIVNFYGGDIWLESTENAGTTFYFTLPKNHGEA